MRNLLSLIFSSASKRQDIAMDLLTTIRAKGKLSRLETVPVMNELAKKYNQKYLNIRETFSKLCEFGLIEYNNSNYTLSTKPVAKFEQEWLEFLTTGEVKNE